jgi:carbon-monoxide dehydrogenase catalytic subunit
MSEIGKLTIDKASQEVLENIQQIETVWDRYEEMQPQCGFGSLGMCCRNCVMGPCRIDPFGEGPQKGICGATAEIITARNLMRMIASGASAHSDHGRDIAHTLLLAGEGKVKDYTIKDEEKLKSLAEEYGINTENISKEQIAVEVAKIAYSEFSQQEGELQVYKKSTTQKTGNMERTGYSAPRN